MRYVLSLTSSNKQVGMTVGAAVGFDTFEAVILLFVVNVGVVTIKFSS